MIRGYIKDDIAYLNVEDVARGLGFTQEKNSVEYVKWERIGSYLNEIGFSPKVGKNDFIPENAAYRLAMKANNELARAFQAKLADEIIPSIRKHGAYMTPATIERALTDPDFLIELANTLKSERAARIKAERDRDILLHTSKTYTSTEIAKELGMPSAKALNKELALRGIQYKQNGTWIFYSKYASMGLTSIKQTVLDNGRIVYDRKFTDTGRDWILSKFGKEHS